jgi:hypothetical protein
LKNYDKYKERKHIFKNNHMIKFFRKCEDYEKLITKDIILKNKQKREKLLRYNLDPSNLIEKTIIFGKKIYIDFLIKNFDVKNTLVLISIQHEFGDELITYILGKISISDIDYDKCMHIAKIYNNENAIKLLNEKKNNIN